MHHQSDFDTYVKLAAAAGMTADGVDPPPPVMCTALALESQCNSTALLGRCRWQPKPGQPQDGGPCADSNSYPALSGLPFACSSYKSESGVRETETAMFKSMQLGEGCWSSRCCLLFADEFKRCGVDAVAQECAVMCDRSDFCPDLEYECADMVGQPCRCQATACKQLLLNDAVDSRFD